MLERVLEPEVMDTAEEAASYDEMDHSEVNSRFAAELLQKIPVPSAGGRDRAAAAGTAAAASPQSLQLLDVGTGTAQIPIEMCRRLPVLSVTAIDASVEMLRVGQRNLEDAGMSDRIRLLCCDARDVPADDGQFDVVTSNSIVHHLPDPVPVIREMIRVLRPGGLLFVRDLLRPSSEQELNRLVEQYAGHESDHARQLFRDSLHASLTVPELVEMFAEAGGCGASIEQTSDRHWTAELQRLAS